MLLKYDSAIMMLPVICMLTCMNKHMSAQMIGTAEGCITVLAYVRFRAGREGASIPIQHKCLKTKIRQKKNNC